MVDRALILHTIEGHLRPSGTQAEAIRKLLDKALVESLQTLPLEAAVKLPRNIQSDIAIVIRDTFSQKDAEKLSASWEPSRKLDPDTKGGLKSAIVDLLYGTRSVYEPPHSMTLAAARDLSGTDASGIRMLVTELASSADLKQLLKRWDPHLKPVPATRATIVKRLSDLLDGTAPATKATPSKKAKK